MSAFKISDVPFDTQTGRYRKRANIIRDAGICRRNEIELNKSGDQFGIEKRYTKYEDVLADPNVDYVHINSPIPDHAWMSIAALDAGKHVMCTVPMATTVDECRQIVEKVAETGLKYMIVGPEN